MKDLEGGRKEPEIINLDDLKQILPKAPWKKARELEERKVAEFITMEDIYNKALAYKNPRDQCLFILAYVTAGRIQEIVQYQKRWWGKKYVRLVKNGKARNTYIADYKKIHKAETIKPSIKKEDFTIERKEGKEILVIRLRNLKNRKRERATKLIPLPLNKEINKKFFQIIDTYLQGIFDEDELFPFSARRGEQIIAKVGMNPHFLRKCRLTHLAKYYNFTDQKLELYAGWTDSRPSKEYIKLRWEDLIKDL